MQLAGKFLAITENQRDRAVFSLLVRGKERYRRAGIKELYVPGERVTVL